jgi:hypothetical protein
MLARERPPGVERFAAWSSPEDYLRARAPALLPGNPGVEGIVPLAPHVWEVALEGGQKLVAKFQLFGAHTRGRAHDLLKVEQVVLDLLGEGGCPVPRLLGLDAETRFVFFEHCGTHTLDDVVQEGGAANSGCYTRKAIAGLCRIEEVLSENRRLLAPLVYPAGQVAHLLRAWDKAGLRAREGLGQIFRFYRRSGAPAAARCRSLLDQILLRLARRCPFPGTTDYNARNIVIDPPTRRLSFIEFAKIGWDWSERRLVQYTASMGAGRPDGSFTSLLDREAVRQYASSGGRDPEGRTLALDGHHIVFHLNAAALLCGALESPQIGSQDRLLQAWQRPRRRLRQCAAALAAILSDVSLTTEFRAVFNQLVNPEQEEHDHE